MGTPRVCRPADYLPPETVGQWPPAAGRWWIVKRAATQEPTRRQKGAHSKLPGWQPKEKATQLPQEGELSKQRGWHQCTKGREPKDPTAQEVKGVAAQLASTWLLRQLLGCEQVLLELSLCSAPQLRQWHAYWVVFPSSRHTLVSFLSSQTRMPPNSSLTTRQSQRHGVMCGCVRHCACLFGLKGYDVLRTLSVWELQSCRSLLA